MRYIDIFRLSWCNVFRHKTRAIFALLSVAIGVISVTIIVTFGLNVSASVQNELKNLGLSGIVIYQDNENSSAEKLQALHIDKIKELPYAMNAMSIITEMGIYKNNTQSGNILIWGIDENFKDTFNVELLHGRLLDIEDVKNISNVVIVDNNLALSLYGRENIVGREILISIEGYYEEYTVIGVITSQKSGLDMLSSGAIPSFVYMSNNKLTSITGKDNINQIIVKPDDENIEQCMSSLNSFFKSQPEFLNTIKIENMSGYLENINLITFIITSFISAVAGVSLIVAMIGVTGSMLSAANERKREIGIYIALGIKSHDIKNCFIWEAAIVCISGGILGSIISGFIISIIEIFLDLNIYFNLFLPLCMVGFCAIGGIVSGVIPAIKAIKFDVIHSLRDL